MFFVTPVTSATLLRWHWDLVARRRTYRRKRPGRPSTRKDIQRRCCALVGRPRPGVISGFSGELAGRWHPGAAQHCARHPQTCGTGPRPAAIIEYPHSQHRPAALSHRAPHRSDGPPRARAGLLRTQRSMATTLELRPPPLAALLRRRPPARPAGGAITCPASRASTATSPPVCAHA
jgi:hypothetical protein